MKEKKKDKKSAEDWVAIARKFGEDCVKIQQEKSLNIHEKLEKQKAISEKMAKQISSDPHLSDEDKKQMIQSIHSYLDECKAMNETLQKAGFAK